MARRSLQQRRPVHTDFLDPPQQEIAALAARKAGAGFRLWDDWEDAERRMAAFLPDEETETDFPVRVLRYTWDDRFVQPGHRDFLGAMLALGLERAALGDIELGNGTALVPATRAAAALLLAELTRAGRAPVRGCEAAPEEARPAPSEWQEVRATLRTPRLDAVVAAGWRISRGDAQEAVRRELVKVNHRLCSKPDALVAEGSLVSYRGRGRLRVMDLGETTRSGRLHMFAMRTKK
ncbi:MAG: YlmH/Sll1252 family protein [Christensenellales bacterium]